MNKTFSNQTKVTQTRRPKKEKVAALVKQRIIIANKMRILLNAIEKSSKKGSDKDAIYIKGVQRRFQMSGGGLHKSQISKLNRMARKYNVRQHNV